MKSLVSTSLGAETVPVVWLHCSTTCFQPSLFLIHWKACSELASAMCHVAQPLKGTEAFPLQLCLCITAGRWEWCVYMWIWTEDREIQGRSLPNTHKSYNLRIKRMGLTDCVCCVRTRLPPLALKEMEREVRRKPRFIPTMWVPMIPALFVYFEDLLRILLGIWPWPPWEWRLLRYPLSKRIPSSIAMFPSLRQSISNDWYIGEGYKGPGPHFSITKLQRSLCWLQISMCTEQTQLRLCHGHIFLYSDCCSPSFVLFLSESRIPDSEASWSCGGSQKKQSPLMLAGCTRPLSVTKWWWSSGLWRQRIHSCSSTAHGKG